MIFLNLLFSLLLLVHFFHCICADPFTDVSLYAGMVRPHGPRKKFGGPAIADIDGDGWPDFLFGHHGGKDCIQVYFNNRNGTFSLSPFFLYRDLHGITPLRLFPEDRRMHFITSNGGRSGTRPNAPDIYSVRGDRMIEELTEWSPDFATTFVRGRSSIVLSMRTESHSPRPDVLLINRADKLGDHHRAFEIDAVGHLNSQPIYPSEFRNSPSQFAALTDIDGDGLMEVMLLDHLSMWKLVSDFSFTDISLDVFPDYSSERYDGTWAISDFDLDNDGRWDLFITRSATGHHSWYASDPSVFMCDVLLRNVDGQRYEDITSQANIPAHSIEPRSQGVTTADFDNDGYVDIFIVRHSGNPGYILLRNLGNGTFEQIDPGFYRPLETDGDGVVAVDYNRDGRVDLVISEGNWGKDLNRLGYYRIMKNVWITGNSFLLVRVKSAPSLNATSLHATVVVTLPDGQRLMRRVGSPGTMVSVSYVELVHFGIGKWTSCDEVSVRWTDGSARRLLNVRANRTLIFGAKS